MGAWEHGPLENDSAQDWFDGFCQQLAFTLNHAFWSRYQEEGIAAAFVLSQVSKQVAHRLGHYIFNEALEVVESELRPENLNPWRHPVKRKRSLLKLKTQLIKVQPPGLKLKRKRLVKVKR